MQVSIRLGEPFWRAAGTRNLVRDLPPGADAAALLARLCAEFPPLQRELEEAPPHIFVNEEEAAADTPLSEGCHIVLVWAVAGG